MKKIFISFALLCVASYGGYKMYNSYESVSEEDFLLQNVEALADNTESVSIDDCYVSGRTGFTEYVNCCHEETTENKIYSCNQSFIVKGVRSKCIAKN